LAIIAIGYQICGCSRSVHVCGVQSALPMITGSNSSVGVVPLQPVS